MLDQFRTYLEDSQKATLVQYCRMEHVSLAALIEAGKPPRTMRLKMKAAAFRALQRLDRVLNALMRRLTAEMEHGGAVPGGLS